MKKRLLALLLGCAMIAGAFGNYAPTAYAIESSGACGEGFSYTFDSGTGTLSITQTGNNDYMDPWYFQEETDIKSAVFNEGITIVCNGTFFQCTSLTSVTLPQSIKEIESSVFNGTDNLKDVYYNGTKEQWADVQIKDCNVGLANAAIHCTDGDTVYEAPEKQYDYDVSDIVKAEFVAARDIFAGFDDYTDGIGVNLTMSDGKTVYIDWGHRYDVSYEGNAGKYILNLLSDTLDEIYVNSDNGGDEYIKFSVDKASLDENGHIKTPGNFTVNILISDNFKFSYNKSLQMNAIENPVTGLETIHPSTRKISLSDLQSDTDIIKRTDIVVNYADSTKAPLWGTLSSDSYSGWIYDDGSSSWFVCCSRLYPENSITPVLDIHGKHRYLVEYVLGKDPEELVVGQTYPLVIKYMGQEVTTYIAVTENETENFDYDPDNDDDNNNPHTHTPGNAVQENIRAASCVANGSYDEVVYCSECGQEISRQSKVIPATGHTWDSGSIVKAATTKEIGIRRFTCTKCHAATRDEMIQKLALKKQAIRVSSKASKTVTYKSSALKKKSASFSISAKAKGKITYKVTKGSAKNIKVSAKGKVTLKKGCKKGTYKVSVTARATSVYQKATKTIVIKVK